ncbi:MAG: hypothetical protein MUF44_05010 [Hydrogenophaga sp.]|jgi:hypothetical protein|nr:hypothetical protein [Hydrogenophaga sp.]
MSVLLPIIGWAADPSAVSSASETPPSTALLPLAAAEPSEPRSNTSLRSVLRQPFDDYKEDSKPYRLSVQERQRLREQLSGQSPYDPIKK